MENMRAYGAGMASTGFDPAAFIRKPTVVFRIAALVCGLIVWICVSGGAWHKPRVGPEICLYGGSPSVCSFGAAMGFFAVLGAGALIFSDAYFDRISAVQTRKRVVMGDFGASVSFTALFALTFIILWSKYLGYQPEGEYSGRAAKFAIFFSFNSLLVWGGASFFAWRRYQEGAQLAFASTYETDFNAIGGGTVAGDYAYGYDQQQNTQPSYQNAPFTASNAAQVSPVDSSFRQPY